MKSYLDAYEKMALIRMAEEEIAHLYFNNKIMSFVHFYVGQEAVAVGVCDNLTKEDRVLGNHRSHGHYLAKGGDLKKMICELLGKENGLAGGKGGSMHMIDKSINFIGSTPILGSVAPIACGSAFEQMYNKKKSITAAFIGDGAFEEGIVYETLNLAALFKNPLLLVVENNLYAVNSKLKDRRSENYNTENIVTGFGVKYLTADGNDYADVSEKAKKLIDEIRINRTPAVLECKTYRHMAHSAPIFDDAQGYREEDTPDKRLEKCSVKNMRNFLLEKGVSEKKLTDIELKTRKKILESIKFAMDSKYPKKANLYKDLYA